ncbi:MAG: FkbM family methyltransferase [Alphaproteobacteria bacterium]|nr:FkbM family methyltransferase [Alphaproteobacteria bacterium]
MTVKGARQLGNEVRTYLYIKHLAATSGLAHAARSARRLASVASAARHPHLGMLSAEDEMIDACLKRFISARTNCLDIGAHIGSVAHRLRELAPDGDLTLIEPSEMKAAWLKRRFGEANVIRAAASDASGSATFFDNADAPGYSRLRTRNGAASEEHVAGREYEVPLVRLDDLFADRRVDFIKIDVEGHELPALKGGAGLLARCRPVILFEAGAIAAGAETDDAMDLFDWLEETFGYRIFPAFHLIYDRRPISRDTFREYRRYPFACFNYFALPPEAGAPNGTDADVATARGDARGKS